MTLNRREAICAGAVAALGIPSLPRFLLAEWERAVHGGGVQRPYLDAALRAEHWLRSVAITTPTGRTWPATPGHATRGRPDPFLYSGAPGVVLFYLDLHGSTGEKRFLDEAVSGAADLAASTLLAGVGSPTGLYAGVAGQAIILDKVAEASGRAELRASATRLARLVATAHRSADPKPNEVTDIVSGTAGAGLSLLALKHLLGDEAISVASAAADRLITAALPAGGRQRRWLMAPNITRELPNFSHGTAGVSYFLATFFEQGGRWRRHLNAALDGARYLESLMVASGEGQVIRHNSTDQGKDLFYLSWCHGPAGTGRLWERLSRFDTSVNWRNIENRGAAGIIAQGVPEKRPAGFWNNISQCCGNAGVAEYFLARYRRAKDPADLAYAQRHADDLLRRGAIDGDAERWIQAEHRVQPAMVEAQTGWMQGAAGVGAMLLHLDAAMQGNGVRPASTLPDSPW